MRLSLYVLFGLGAAALLLVLLAWFAERRLEQQASACLTSDPSRLADADVALVLGAEGKGLRQLTRDTCSIVARLDMPGEIKSLNVSNAAVLALYIGASQLGLMG